MFYFCCSDLEKLSKSNDYNLYFLLMSYLSEFNNGFVRSTDCKASDVYKIFCKEYKSTMNIKTFRKYFKKIFEDEMIIVVERDKYKYYAIPANCIKVHHSIFNFLYVHATSEIKQLYLILCCCYNKYGRGYYFYLKDILKLMGKNENNYRLTKQIQQGLKMLQQAHLIDWEYCGDGYKMRLLNVRFEEPLDSENLNIDSEFLNGGLEFLNEEDLL